MRQGERLPAPAAVDVNIHAVLQGADSFVEFLERKALKGSLSKPPGSDNQEGKTADTMDE